MFSSTNYHYDAAGQLIELASRFADAEAPDRTVKSKYDKYGRLARVVYDDSRTEEYTRDTWGKILKVTATDGETVRESTLTYDYFDRLIEQIETVNGKLAVSNTYAYNAYGQRTLRETQTPLGPQTETREYDQFGRLVLIESGSDKVEYQYNALNQVETQTVNGMEIAFTYTPQGQLQTKTLGGDVATLEYFYAPSGQLTGRSVNGEKVDYQYDARGQLLAVVNATGEAIERYAYDPAGNILEKTVDGVTTTFTYDAANQLVTSTKGDEVTNYAYDAAGRLVKSGQTEYSYGWMDKVLSITENESVTREVSYYLNGQVAQVNDLSNQSVESFVWDGLALIQRNAVNYLNEPAVTGGNPVSVDGKVLFNDLLGSSLGVIDSEGFEGIQRTSFGEVKESNDFNFYTGKPEIEGLGYAFLFRNYQASNGKWQTTDPMGYPDGWNNLAYVNNGVTMAIDRFGRDITHLLDSNGALGAGHSAWIVGNDEDGYTAYDYPTQTPNTFSSFGEALDHLNSTRDPGHKYTQGQTLPTTQADDAIANTSATSYINDGYFPGTHDCYRLGTNMINDINDTNGTNYDISNAWFPNNAFDENLDKGWQNTAVVE